MELRSFEAIMTALNENEVRYLVVGGMAVVAHGYGRMTHDVDLVVQLDPENIRRTFAALASLGYQPRAPITAEAFTDSANRRRWIAEKGMTVLNLYSDRFRTTPVDLFVEEPFDFDEAHARAETADIEGVSFRYADLVTLIRMKEAAGRPVDLEDVRQLKLLLDEKDAAP